MKFLKSSFFIPFAIALVAAILFLPYLGSVHLFDWDENIFAESAREMLITGNYFKIQSNFFPFEEKPPLFFWLQALSMQAFGVNEYAARFPNAITGIITLVLVYLLGRKYFSHQFGLYWTIAYLGSFLPHFYFRTAIIDPTFNLFIFSGIFSLAILVSTNSSDRILRIKLAILAGLLIGLAILTKGPVALLIVLLTGIGFMIFRKSLNIITFWEVFSFLIMLLITSSAWFAVEVYLNGPWFIKEFITYQWELLKVPHSGHRGPVYFHFVVLLLGCFPVSFFVIKGLRAFENDNFQQRNIKAAMMIMMLVVLLLFSIVKTKLVHYSSLCYFSISFFAAYVLVKHESRRIIFGSLFKVLLSIIGFAFGFVFLLANFILIHKTKLLNSYSHLIKDQFALGCLSAPVEAIIWGYLPGVVFIAGLLYFLYKFRYNLVLGALVFFGTTIISVQILTYYLVPKIEYMIQGEAINFYKEKGKEDAYLNSYGFKSYATLFYGKKRQGNSFESTSEKWLLGGEIDKPVYLVSHAIDKRLKVLDTVPDLKMLYTKNGYAFFKREPDAK